MTALSPHFSMAELIGSRVACRAGLPNSPDVFQVENLRRLADSILEPIRALFVRPVYVSSGFRSPELNRLVGGKSSSAHLEGRAADILVTGIPCGKAFAVIRESAIPFDQLIHEKSSGVEWLHVSIPRLGVKPRRQAFTQEV